MKITDKILKDVSDLNKWVEQNSSNGGKIVICQGHFNVIHPGHLRFLEFAREHGQHLLVALHGEKKIDKEVKDKFYGEHERARGVASLEYVEKVFIFNDVNFENILDIVKPSVYVMGQEFVDRADEFKNEIELVESFGGEVIFSSGDISYASNDFLDKNMIDLKKESKQQFKNAFNKQKIFSGKLFNYIDTFHKKHILVVGETIVDQYVACDAVGMSSEAPVLVVKEVENKEFVGGAAVVARHIRALGLKCTFVSVVGNDTPATLAKESLEKEGIIAELFVEKDRPTIYKIRYMVDTQKILRVSRLKEHHINSETEEKIIESIDNIVSDLDGIIVSDFGYGVLTPKILDYLSVISKKHNIKLFGDSQSSSQIGNIANFKDYFLLTPTEREVRIALGDKYNGLEFLGNKLLIQTGAKNVVLKLNSKGFISFERTENKYFVKTQYFPALNPNPIDVVGAGDSLLTGLASACCCGANLMEASAIGATIASIAISKMGNVPIGADEVRRCLKEFC